MIKNKHVKLLIDILQNITYPNCVKKRKHIFKIIKELNEIFECNEVIRKSYETEEFIRNEKEKYEYLNSKKSEEGIEMSGIKISKSDISEVIEYILKKNQCPHYKAYIEYYKYMDEPCDMNLKIPIDYILEDDIQKLSVEELEILTEILE